MTDLARFEVSIVSDGARMDGSAGSEVTLLEVAGEIDIGTSPHLHRELELLLASRNTLVLDMAKVEFIDASGIGVLLDVARHARSLGATMLLRSPSRRVVRVLDILQINGALAIEGPSE